MAQGAATAYDVPAKYDVVINGFGYQVLDSIEPSLPFRTHRAIYSYTPTFVDRQNVSGNYGDNQQAFWLTASQNDLSLGEGQAFLRLNDADSLRRCWQVFGDLTQPGYASSTPSVINISAVSSSLSGSKACCEYNGKIHFADATNLYRVDTLSNVTNLGAHGAGTPSSWGMCSDSDGAGGKLYISGASIRAWDGSVFSTFSAATNAGSIAYNNNTLYSVGAGTNSNLYSYDSAGNQTTVFPWRGADGSGLNPSNPKVCAFGGTVLILIPNLGGRSQLWEYDGTNTNVLAEFPRGAITYDLSVLDGIVFISGVVLGRDPARSSQPSAVPVVWYYANGNYGELWRSPRDSGVVLQSGSNVSPALGTYCGSLIFTDFTGSGTTTTLIKQYNPGTGAVSTIGSFTKGTANTGIGTFIASAATYFGYIDTGTNGTNGIYPISLSSSTVLVDTSQIDFESSLTKVFKSVRIDYTGTGNVSVNYQVDGVLGGTYLNLATNMTSGTEYAFPAGSTGNAVALQIGLAPSNGLPMTLKRYYVRAAPLQDTFPERTYILDLSGVGFKDPVILNDGSTHPLSGFEQALNLDTAIKLQASFSITDKFGTFTGLCDPANCEIYEWREGNDSPDYPGGYVAKMTVRGV